MSEGLSQEDFRRLMATPRRPNETEATSKPPAASKSSDAIFAKPRSMRKPNFKKPFNKRGPTADDSDEEKEEKIDYRDRAAERRQQIEDPTDDARLSTEELLQRTQMEAGEELDAKRLYEQSKYLGGDIQHTHLVKGLDFALLKKVRTDLVKKKDHVEEEEKEEEAMVMEQETEQDLDQVLEKFERGEKIEDDIEQAPVIEVDINKPKFHTLMAKNIHDYVIRSNEPQRVELFEPGRMSFIFELADEVGHYSDAFAVPTAVIRSKTDVTAKLSKLGWSEDTQAETNLVIEKITQVMEGVRRGDRIHGNTIDKQQKVAPVTKITSQPIAVVEDAFMGDIFADVGRDYELEESTVEKSEQADKSKNYFQGLVDEDEEMPDANNDAVNALLSKATAGFGDDEKEEKKETEKKEQLDTVALKKRKYNTEMDADADDIDMFGLSSSALPTSFEEHQSNTTAYQSDDEDNEKNEDKSTQFVDQGTNRNKKAQLTRWDFDTEEEWHKYKSSIEINPKSAFQFGVKLGDGRKRNRERKGMNDKQRLDRDYQQVKNIMSQKYGKNL